MFSLRNKKDISIFRMKKSALPVAMHPKYWDTLSNYHPKVWTGPFYFLLMYLKYCCIYGKRYRPWSDATYCDLGLHCLQRLICPTTQDYYGKLEIQIDVFFLLHKNMYPLDSHFQDHSNSIEYSHHTFVNPYCSALWIKISADAILKYFSKFSQKTGFDISCKLSAICMKCQVLFSGKNK